MIKSNKKKFITTTLIEILFTIILIFLLVSIRQRALGYLHNVQSLSEDISGLEQDLLKENLTSYDKQNVQTTLGKMESDLDKGLFLIRYILPISLMALSLIFYAIIWFIVSKTKIFRFLLSAAIAVILLLTASYFTLSYIAYSFDYIADSPLILLIISLVLLNVSYYLFLFLASNNKSVSYNLKLGVKSLKKIILPFVLNLFTNIIYFVLVFILFFLTYVKESIIIPAIILFFVIVIINLQRINLVNKISKL